MTSLGKYSKIKVKVIIKIQHPKQKGLINPTKIRQI